MAKSYYGVINGVRYDRGLLETAESLVEGSGDGRISFEDATKLWDSVMDGEEITATELDTLQYIREHFKLTDKAAEWLDGQLDELELESLEEIIAIILEDEFDLPELEFFADEDEIYSQSQLENVIDFDDALRIALTCFLEDGHDLESPRNVVAQSHNIYPDSYPDKEEYEVALTAKLREYFQEAVIDLVPLEMPEDEEEWDFSPPQNGEPVAENWIFHLYIPDLSDHSYWAVISRKDEKLPYNYGFN